jgi:DMSO/TMAO reductase YedYZ molybdopterin-dependent catalytic subunit
MIHNGIPAAQHQIEMLEKSFGLVQTLRPEGMTKFITPAAELFSVWHLGIPDVRNRAWTLTIRGRGETLRTLTLDDLRRLPQTELTAVHECAGSPLKPEIPQRRVGNVRWRGVRLRDVLAEVGAGQDAAYIISTGCDRGVFDSRHYDCYEKDLPAGKALDSALIALSLNGEPLPVEHGGPLRLVVPGYYGTNSTKWLTELRTSDHRSTSAFTTKYYMDPPTADSPTATPVWELAPNSCLVAPTDGRVHLGQPVEIWGWAWAAEPVTTVDVTTDGGHTWTAARVADRSDYEWQRFSLSWTPSHLGEHILACCAKTLSGKTQPTTPWRNRIYQRIIFVTQETSRTRRGR